jgi:hypothetical protein
MRTTGSTRGSNVEGRSKHVHGDRVALQPITPAGKGLVDEVLQEPLPALRLLERPTL